MIEAVAFDLGGVVLESPLAEIERYERQCGIRPGSINRAVATSGSAGAWAAHERGELTSAQFNSAFAGELEGIGVDGVDVGQLMRRIEEVAIARPAMLAAVELLRAEGFAVAAVTNNWRSMPVSDLRSHFDLMIESCVEGVRKPEEAIYLLLLEQLGVPAEKVVFLDDIGANLKTARGLGMSTIKVIDPRQALVDLGSVVGTRLD